MSAQDREPASQNNDREAAKALFYEGLDLLDGERFAAAEAVFQRALLLAPGTVPLLANIAICQRRQSDFGAAKATAETILRLDAGNIDALLTVALCLVETQDYREASACLRKVIALDGSVAEAHNNLGICLRHLGRTEEAIECFRRADALEPDNSLTLLNLGNAFTDLKRHDLASLAYDRAYSLTPDAPALEGARLHAKMQVCDWSDHAAESDRLLSSAGAGKVTANPFLLLAVTASAQVQKASASAWAARFFPAAPYSAGKAYRHDRIRLAYLSADFSEHPVSYLLAGIFELHDRRHFETTAVSLDRHSPTPFVKRVQASFDHVIDAVGVSDAEIVRRMRQAGIDIAIDLGGFTRKGRPAILAARPAPVQVNLIGYPATMGTQAMDYIIADPYLIPPRLRHAYSECVVALPDVYQPNDHRRAANPQSPSREDFGLPSTGFVFCCHNAHHKITPAMFDVWLGILRQVPGSVLWLLAGDAPAADNLRSEATSRGLDPARLVFAKRAAYADYLAAYRRADLFLDTHPFNAGTTASDALFMGLPVVTLSGEAYASRMAGSLLSSLGLPELIAASVEDYARVAMELATQPVRLAAIRQKLRDNGAAGPTFDAGRYTRHLEAAYGEMYRRSDAGLAPDHIEIKAGASWPGA